MALENQTGQIRIQAISPRDEQAVAKLWEIYAEAIPTEEQKTLKQLQAMLRRRDYQFLVARRDESVGGFAIVYQSDFFDLLEYLAVREVLRGKGIGAALFREAVMRTNDGPLIVEVDRADNQDARRRADFYRRLGCKKMAGLEYILPLPAAPPMELFVHTSERVMGREILRRNLATIYARVYGQAENDPRIEKMMEKLGREVELV